MGSGLPARAELALMERLAHTYGKTWHTWHTDQDKSLPVGVPQLMMGFIADGQADPAMVEQRNRRPGVNAAKTKAQRADIQIPAAAPQADGWQHGNVVQITIQRGLICIGPPNRHLRKRIADQANEQEDETGRARDGAAVVNRKVAALRASLRTPLAPPGPVRSAYCLVHIWRPSGAVAFAI